MLSKLVIALALSWLATITVFATTNKVICYHGTWSTYRQSNGQFSVEHIDPTLCTHLIYSFIGLQDDGSVKHLDPRLDTEQGNLKRFNDLKLKNKNLKTLIAIGGWGEGSERYSRVAADPAKRARLIQSALSLVKTYGYDGFDLDWEYPAQRGGGANDKKNYATLLKEFRQEWDKHGLLLTAAVFAAPNGVDISYDVPALSKYLDFINVMAYDFHGSWEGVAGQNAPLYASSLDYSRDLNVDASIRGWIQRGAAPEKIALGLGVYGRSFTLSTSKTSLGAPISNVGNPGKYTQEPGMLGYNEIVELLSGGGWTQVWDDQQKNPYAFKGNQWIGYDDPRSIAIKVEYAKSLNLGAVMIWSIETDDFKGVSGTKFPILRSINQALGGVSNENGGSPPAPVEPVIVPEVPAPAPEVPAPAPEAPAPVPDVPVTPTQLCTKAEYVRDPTDCAVFYYCLPNNGQFVPLKQSCGSGLVYDTTTHSCNYKSAVKC